MAARRLQECGAHVIVILMEGLPSTDNARHMYGMLDDTGVKVLRYEEASSYLPSMVESADFILDAVYGVGFHGSAPQFMEPVFRAVTNSRGVTLALDVPSGVNCDTGAVEGPCVMADYTVSFSTLKNGHLLQPAKGCCGQVVVVPIGIDLSLINAQESPLEVTDTELAQRVIKPRNPESNKGDYGRLLCLCGSEGMAGAASLCAEEPVWSTSFFRDPFIRLLPPGRRKPFIPSSTTLPPGRLPVRHRRPLRRRLPRRMQWCSAVASARDGKHPRCFVSV